MTKNRSLVDEYKAVQKTSNQTGFENFARQLALGISSILRSSLTLIESITNTHEPNEDQYIIQQCVKKALEILVQLSYVTEDELFKICLDFWHFFSLDIYTKLKENNLLHNVNGMNLQILGNQSFMHSQVYHNILDDVKEILIDFMARPKEVLVVIDENGEAVEEHFDDTENIFQYEIMRETIIYLTNIDAIAMDRCI